MPWPAISAVLAILVLGLGAVVAVLVRRLRAAAEPVGARPPPAATPAAPGPGVSRDMVQREKLAALGQLVAGVAHELNTPMGAIRASAGNLDAAVERVLLGLAPTLASLDAPGRAAFLGLARGTMQTRFTPMTSRQERRLRRALARQLDTAGASAPDELARLLAEMGAQEDLGPHLPLLTRPDALALVREANELVALRRNADNIRLASERAGTIVQALKGYAYPGGAKGTVFAGALTDNLDTVLTLYHSQIKAGIELVRRYDEAGHVAARHDELNQVWANLIHNALQAMGATGTLTIGVHDEPGDRLRVDIGDDGPGVPAAYLDRIFDPFFTTKETGEGSGLGLAISREIVAAHGGELRVRSAPGQTVFSVVLRREGLEVAPP